MKISSFLLTLMTCLLLLSCSNAIQDPNLGPDFNPNKVPQERTSLRQLADCEDYRRSFTNSITRQLLDQGLLRVMPMMMEMAVSSDVAVSADANSVPTSITGTNLQETTVDEPDLVKTMSDGTMLVLQEEKLHILRAFPPTEMSLLASLSIGVPAEKMFLDESHQKVVILATSYGYTAARNLPTPDQRRATLSLPIGGSANTEVIFVDISDRTKPKIINRWLLQGSLLDGRRPLNNRIQLAIQVPLQLPNSIQNDLLLQKKLGEYYEAKFANNPDQDLSEMEIEIGALVEQAVSKQNMEEILPNALLISGSSSQEIPWLGCDEISEPDLTLNSLGMTLLVSFESDGSNYQTSAVLNNAWQLYGSSKHLFLIQGSSGWWWNAEQSDQTAIWQLDWQSGHPVYEGSGLVDGQVLNSFSLSEYEGYLRVATTERPNSPMILVDDIRQVIEPSQSLNHLFVLKLANGENSELEQVGSVLNLAPGERVQSARFVGDRGYVVTFRQVDPLFAFDLSTPNEPTLEGELKIPGFSNYMHPLGETHLLTVGPAGDDDGLSGEWQAQLFDVSDLKNPEQVDTLIPSKLKGGRAYSEAGWDHHAFTYDPRSKLLVTPIQGYGKNWESQFSGFSVIEVGPELTSLTERGWIEHEGKLSSDCEPSLNEESSPCKFWNLKSQPRRSLLMSDNLSDYLYTISNTAVQTHQVGDFTKDLAEVNYP
ncbi:MAG: beta-propeller domain-containing protein [bacterium]